MIIPNILYSFVNYFSQQYKLSWEFIASTWKDPSSSLPPLIQNIGLAYLAILIPMVLFIFSFEKNGLFFWDKSVILSKVIQVKKSLLCTAYILFFPLFWEYYNLVFKSFLFTGFLIAIVQLYQSLKISYQWIAVTEVKGERDERNIRDKLRTEYLDELKDQYEIEKIWSLTWRKKIKNIIDEHYFIKKFHTHVILLANEGNKEALVACLLNFEEFMNKRNLEDIFIFAKLLNLALHLNFLFYKNRKTTKGYILNNIIENLLNKFLVQALQNNMLSSILFGQLEKQIEDKDHEYIQQLFNSTICDTFFQHIGNAKSSFDIWQHAFPQQWKITLKSMRENNLIAILWFEKFIHWVDFTNEQLRKSINELISGLFPEIFPEWWGQILVFPLMKKWHNENRSEILIEIDMSFLRDRVRGFSTLSLAEVDRLQTQEMENEQRAAIKLASYTMPKLFPQDFNSEKLTQHINQLRSLTPKNVMAAQRQKICIRIFENLLSEIASPTPNPTVNSISETIS